MGCLICCCHDRDLILPDVCLPPQNIFTNNQIISMLLDLDFKTEKNILKWNSKSSDLFEMMKGRPKTDKDIVKKIQKHFVKNIILNRDALPADYKHFGNDNSVENLQLFCANNPFFASALSVSKDDKTGKLLFHVNSRRNSEQEEHTWFTKLVATLDDSYTRVNATFDQNLNLISQTVYQKGNEVKMSDQDACSYLLLLLVYYSEVVHANIHIFHVLMVTAMADSTYPFKAIHEWAQPYFPNVFLKFKEVKLLLFGEGGALTGGVYKSDCKAVLSICRDMFLVWGHSRNAVELVEKFLLVNLTKQLSLKDISNFGILTEFFKHVGNINGYATEIYNEFKKINNGIDLKLVDENLKLFLSNSKASNVTFEVSKVDNLATWIELMSVTGIIHGSTLSFTRLIMTHPIVSIITPDDKYGELDTFFMRGGSGTIVGMMEENHVYSDQIQEKTSMSPTLKSILYKYAGLSNNLKSEYYNKISKDENFKNHGWVLTDNCIDGIDGKQLTLTTYI